MDGSHHDWFETRSDQSVLMAYMKIWQAAA